MPPKRKKWTEAEEKTLIAKYGDMVSEGTLAKMKTREKKFKPIALYVNSMHHARDPIAYPWQWTWKDVSTKVQNMRHQYSLVKQKVKNPNFSAAADGSEGGGGGGGGDCSIGEEFDWVEGLTHWSNFLLYKEVFGDLPISYGSNGNDLMGVLNEDRENGGAGVGGLLVGRRGLEMVEFGHLGNSTNGDFGVIDGSDNGVLALGFDYEGEEPDEHFNGNGRIRGDVDEGFMNEEVAATVPTNMRKRRRKKKELKGLEKRLFSFLSTQVGQLREMESRFEQRELERDRERQRREIVQMERDQELVRKLEEREKEREERDNLRKQRIRELEIMEKEREERERRRRDEELLEEREWEERMNRRRLEWKKRIDGMLNQHREEMGQVQTRILHEQQNLTSQLLGIVSQWAGHPAGLSDHTSASNHYLSQMMQNLHHVNGMVHGDTRVDGDAQDDQFIVDG
ncbi:Reticulocyte-binding protein homolog 2a [Linum perenne]